MKRSLVALSLLGLALAGCSEEQSGDANPDSQVEQPPLPGQTEGRSQGPDAGSGTGASADSGVVASPTG